MKKKEHGTFGFWLQKPGPHCVLCVSRLYKDYFTILKRTRLKKIFSPKLPDKKEIKGIKGIQELKELK